MDKFMNWCRKRPITMPIVGIANILWSVFYYFPHWLFGYKFCAWCHEKHPPGTKLTMVSHGMDELCSKCYNKLYGEEG